jgi:PhoD-like phosphatase
MKYLHYRAEDSWFANRKMRSSPPVTSHIAAKTTAYNSGTPISTHTFSWQSLQPPASSPLTMTTVRWLPLLVTLLGSAVVMVVVDGQQEERPITESAVLVQTGELSDTSAVVMVRCNQVVDSAVGITVKGAPDLTLDLGPVTRETDYTVSYRVAGLTKSTDYEYVATCTAAAATAATSLTASFTTLPGPNDTPPIHFVWVADLSGQGWGRNPDWTVSTVDGRTVTGGYVVFDVMEQLRLDFALFQGDMIYADNAIPPTKEIPDALGGGNWTNDPSKDFVAITFDEFRANWKYNLGDDKMQSFLAKTPVYVQWLRAYARLFWQRFCSHFVGEWHFLIWQKPCRRTHDRTTTKSPYVAFFAVGRGNALHLLTFFLT